MLCGICWLRNHKLKSGKLSSCLAFMPRKIPLWGNRTFFTFVASPGKKRSSRQHLRGANYHIPNEGHGVSKQAFILDSSKKRISHLFKLYIWWKRKDYLELGERNDCLCHLTMGTVYLPYEGVTWANACYAVWAEYKAVFTKEAYGTDQFCIHWSLFPRRNLAGSSKEKYQFSSRTHGLISLTRIWTTTTGMSPTVSSKIFVPWQRK